ncbi:MULTISPECIES: ABC transporter permease subunit [Metabacillus]|uniref:ABC transporter permease subunit n=1 Tax=Metabacillus TaxID=2675233 RepID=UPI0004939E58|nr:MULTISPECIES: ABC transporter permease subunit [Metabacillus]KEZ48618.1 ABC transporter permease [Metabacillus indicus LMG 22858]
MRNIPLLSGLFMLAVLVAVAWLGPVIPSVKEGIIEQRMVFKESGAFERAPFPPSLQHLFGTDEDGRDLLSLVIMGAKETLMLVLVISIIRYGAAILLALLSLPEKSPARALIYSLNGFAASLPIVFAAILFITMPVFTFSPHRVYWIVLILSLSDVGRVAYVFQQAMKSISHTQYVEAGVTIGNSPFGLFSRHYFPNLLPDAVTHFFMDLGKVTLLLGQLGILSIFVTQAFVQLNYGYGELQNTSLNWPILLGMAKSDIISGFWIPFFPALALTYLILTFNLIGEGLRKHFSRI